MFYEGYILRVYDAYKKGKSLDPVYSDTQRGLFTPPRHIDGNLI